MVRRNAVVIDTETTDLFGPLCEVGIVDAAGNVLFESLINPALPIAPAATAVHGITDADVADAPMLAAVLPRLLTVIGTRPILAYNAPYDHAVLMSDAARHGLDLRGIDHWRRWGCLMRARATNDGTHQWRRLEGGHRAIADARAAASLLRHLAYGSRELGATQRPTVIA